MNKNDRLMSIGALVLAAGQSSRFGSDKRTAQLADGASVLATTIKLYDQCFDNLVLVLKADDDHFEPIWPASTKVLYSEHAKGGIGYSLADGIRSIQRQPTPWDLVFIALGDMPFISPTTLMTLKQRAYALLDTMQSGCIVAPTYHEQRGHPVGFSGHFYGQLAQLSGHQGAQALILQHPQQVRRLSLADPGLIRDIDYPHDLPAI